MDESARICLWHDSADEAVHAARLVGSRLRNPVVVIRDADHLADELAGGEVAICVLDAAVFERAAALLDGRARDRASIGVLLVVRPGASVPAVPPGIKVRLLRLHSPFCAALPVLIDSELASQAAERELRETLERLERHAAMLQDAERVAGVGSFVWDLARDRLWISGEFARIRGLQWSDDFVSFERCVGVAHDEDRPRIVAAVESARVDGLPFALDYRIVRSDGTTRCVHCEAQVERDRDGRAVRILGTEQDVTERIDAESDRERLESQLRHAQKLEALGRFATGAAHDFNNVLTTILGHSQLARLALRAPVVSVVDVAEHLIAVEAACRRATSLTRQLLTIGRREPSRVERLDLHAVLVDHEAMLRRLVREDISIDIRFGSTNPIVELGRDAFDQVLMNLVVNACDAMPKGGAIRIETGDVQFDEDAAAMPPGALSGAYVRVRVTDTGVGIPPENLERVFEPFFTTKPRDKGTGLGLAIIQGISTQAGGFVTVSSRVGKGTTFDVHLPVAGAAATAAARADAARDHVEDLGGRETVLFCEDEDRVRESLAAALRARGYRVLEASDAVQALAIAASHHGRIDLLVSDVVLTGMSGPRLARTLVETRPELRVLFVSGYAPDELDDVDAHEVGGARLLEKPFSGTELLRRIRQVLDADPADS
ncbi:MAG: response regulator [Planctomycetes bacterium]|nr:response regulator [Planctomycetota bacterium]